MVSIIPVLLLVLAASLLGGMAARKLRQPLIVGYLGAGLVLSLVVSRFGISKETIDTVAEWGAALLMFTLGLGFAPGQFSKTKIISVFGGLWQVWVTSFLGAVIFQWLFGFDFRLAIVAAIAFSLSSTAIVVKVLEERQSLDSLPGDLLTSWLLVQDMIALPAMTIIGVVLGMRFGFESVWQIGGSLASVVVFIGITIVLGKYLMAKIVKIVADLNSRELLLIFSIIVVAVYGWVASMLGLSIALGAFLAGLVLSQAGEHFAIFAEIRPFKDLFLAWFFVSLGLGLELGFVVTNWVAVGLILLVVIILKLGTVGSYLAITGFHARPILTVSLGLAGVGEFSFILAAYAFRLGIITAHYYSLIAAVTLVSMVSTPWLFTLADKAYYFIKRILPEKSFWYQRFFASFDHHRPLRGKEFANHVIILGYGRVGRWVGSILDECQIPFVVIEYNSQTVRRLKLEGKTVVYGDPSDIGVLEYARVSMAKLIVVAIPDSQTQKAVLTNCLTLNPTINIICRSHIDEDQIELLRLGVDSLVQPEFEAALVIARLALKKMGVSEVKVNTIVEATKLRRHSLNNHNDDHKKNSHRA